jgi:hypothetical protein
MMTVETKCWRSILVQMPNDGRIVECLAISYDDKSAGYSRSRYQWYNGQWWPQVGSPKLDRGWIITHWLDDPDVYPPLPDGWPDCHISEVHEWLKPYINKEKLNGAV